MAGCAGEMAHWWPDFLLDVPMRAISDSAMLVDSFGRRIDALRVSVTDRCDLRCTYCLPKGFKGFEAPAQWLTHAEMARLVGLFVALGVRKVRLTGGEPLLRRGLTGLAAQIAAMPGVSDLSLSSNGTQLAQHAAGLKAAGVQRLNISLDTLDAPCFAQITGRDALADVLDGVMAAKRAGFDPIKLNMVVQGGVNDAEVARMLAFALEHRFILRLIETMPMGDTGPRVAPVDVSVLGLRLAHQFGLIPAVVAAKNGPARYWSLPGHGVCLGVITPLSQHFCDTCNRVRLDATGTLHLCLGQADQAPLGALLRAGATDEALKSAIIAAIAQKPARHDFNTQATKIIRFMSQTGG